MELLCFHGFLMPIRQIYEVRGSHPVEPMGVHSITEQGDLDEFLSTAALADVKFISERMNAQMVLGPKASTARPSFNTTDDATLRRDMKDMLRIPRRYDRSSAVFGKIYLTWTH
jgi:hypothetical protein